MADGNDFNVILHKEAGRPVEIVYPAEGAPLIVCPNAVLKAAPNPNAARLFQSYLFSREGQQLLCDFAAQHSAHPQVKPKPGRTALARDQGDEGRSGRGRGPGGRDQGALPEDFRRVMMSVSQRHVASLARPHGKERCHRRCLNLLSMSAETGPHVTIALPAEAAPPRRARSGSTCPGRC